MDKNLKRLRDELHNLEEELATIDTRIERDKPTLYSTYITRVVPKLSNRYNEVVERCIKIRRTINEELPEGEEPLKPKLYIMY